MRAFCTCLGSDRRPDESSDAVPQYEHAAAAGSEAAAPAAPAETPVPLFPLLPPLGSLARASSDPARQLPPRLELVRARSDAVTSLGQRLHDGRQRFNDETLRRMLDDRRRAFDERTPTASSTKSATSDPGEPPAAALSLPDPFLDARVQTALLPRDSAPWRCSICLQDKPGSIEAHSALCGSDPSECPTTFCEDCLEGYFDSLLEFSRFTVLPVRCPAAGCHRRVATQVWSGLADADTTENYEQSAKDILNFRCQGCDETSTLYVELAEGDQRARNLARFWDLIQPSRDQTDRMDRVLALWGRFSAGACHADDMLDALAEARGCDVADLLAGGDEEELMQLMLELIGDVERRCVLQLAGLRQQSKIKTPCCDSHFCWMCKVGTHHEGQTCEEAQREYMDEEAQCCPGCGVATIRTEGCTHMVCPCGHEWTWKEGRDWDSD